MGQNSMYKYNHIYVFFTDNINFMFYFPREIFYDNTQIRIQNFIELS